MQACSACCARPTPTHCGVCCPRPQHTPEPGRAGKPARPPRGQFPVTRPCQADRSAALAAGSGRLRGLGVWAADQGGARAASRLPRCNRGLARVRRASGRVRRGCVRAHCCSALSRAPFRATGLGGSGHCRTRHVDAAGAARGQQQARRQRSGWHDCRVGAGRRGGGRSGMHTWTQHCRRCCLWRGAGVPLLTPQRPSSVKLAAPARAALAARAGEPSAALHRCVAWRLHSWRKRSCWHA